MVLPVPNPSTAAAGSKQSATVWNSDVRDAILYLLALQGGLGRRNYLKNALMDLWQRGTSFTVAASTKTYVADRWTVYRTATGSTASQVAGPPGQAYGLKYQRNAGDTSTAPMRVIQALPTANSLGLAGKSCSLRVALAAGAQFSPAGSSVSVLVTYGTGTDQSPEAAWTGSTDALSATQVVTTTATEYVFDNIAIPTAATQVKVEIAWTPVGTAGANDYLQINAGQLSVGSMAGFEQIPPEQNLTECQTFYRPIGNNEVSVVYNSATSVIAWCRFDPAMRIAPTPTYPSGTWSINVPTAKTSTNTITPGNTTTNTVTFSHGGFSSLTVAQGGYYNTIPSGGIKLSAEL